MKTSIHFKKQNSGSGGHNDRTAKTGLEHIVPIVDNQKNQTDRSAAAAGEKMRALKIAANANYLALTGQKIKAKNYKWEAVVVIERHHQLADLQRLAKAIEDATGFSSTQVSVHKDEGHIDQTTGEIKYNNHAHLSFFTLDKTTGKQKMNLKTKLNKFGEIRAHRIDMRKMQNLTADVLGMQRGVPRSITKKKHESGRDLREKYAIDEAKKKDRIYRQAMDLVYRNYKELRERMKNAGTYKQKDYSSLKTKFLKEQKFLMKTHKSNLASLKKPTAPEKSPAPNAPTPGM